MNYKVIVALFLAIFLCGCISNKNTISDVKVLSPLKIGVFNRYPFVYRNKDNVITGSDIELLKLFSTKNNYDPNFIEYPSDEIIFAIRRGEIDIIAGGFTKSEMDEEFLASVAPNIKTGQRAIISAKLAPFITEKSQLNNNKVTVYTVITSPAAKFARKIFPDVNRYFSLKSVNACVKKVRGETGSILLLDARDAMPLVKQDKSISLVLGMLSSESIVWGTKRKNKTLQESLNSFMTELSEKGKLQEIIDRKWL